MRKVYLLDKYLPRYTFNEYHETAVNGRIQDVYKVASNFDLSKSKMITVLFRFRGLPTKRMRLREFIDDMGFTFLEENPPLELLAGFWMRPRIEKIPSYEVFVDGSMSSWVKCVWNFRLEEMESGQTKVSTETRILCVKPITKLTFGTYWIFVKPFSGLVRKKMLEIIKVDSESHAGGRIGKKA